MSLACPWVEYSNWNTLKINNSLKNYVPVKEVPRKEA